MSDISINIKLVSKAAEQGLDQFGKAADGAAKNLTFFEKVTQQARRSLDSFYGNLGANLAFRAFNGVIGAIGNTIDNVRAFETALVGVGKTTGLAGQDLENLGKEIQNLSKTIPLASTDLLDLGKVSAQLGIQGTDNIIKFTETIARLSFATDVIGEQGAIAFARIINLTGESVQSVDKLGSALVTLGNNFAATESQIVEVATEVAKGGARFGLTSEQVLALSAAMASLGVESDVAGSTTQKVFSIIEKAIGAGGVQLEKFTTLLGLNREEFTNLFKTNPQEFFVQLIESLKRSKVRGKDLSSTLAELGFNDLRVTKTLAPLIERTDLLTKAVRLSNDAYTEGNALNQESDRAFETLDAKLLKLNNSWTALTNNILNAVLPTIKSIVDGLTSIIKLATDTSVVLDTIFLASLFAVAKQLIIVGIGIQAQIVQMGGLVVALEVAKAEAIAFWAAMGGPITIVLAGLAAVGLAIYKISTITDQERLKQLEDARERRRINGQTLEDLDAQIAKLKEKIKTDEDTRKGIKEEIKLVNDLKQARQEQLDLRKAFAGGNAEADSNAANAKVAEDSATQLKTLQEFGQKKIELQRSLLEQSLLIDGEKTSADDLALLANEDRLQTLYEQEQIALAKKAGLNDQANKLALDAQINQTKRSNQLTLEQRKFQEEQNKKKLEDQDNFLNTVSTLQNSSNKTLAAAGKAAAITQIIIKGAEARASSYAFGASIGGPILGAIFEGLAIAAQASQIAQVAGVKFQDGGIVPGTSFSGDNVVARVNSGEMILNREQQSKLFDIANGNESTAKQSGDLIIQIDGEEVFKVVSRRVADGRVLGEGGV